MSVPSCGSLVFLIAEDNGSKEDSVEKIKKDFEDLNSQIERLENLLATDFATKAPAQVVKKEREKLETYRQTAKKLRNQLD